MNWHLQDAKNNLSKLVQRARSDGPQTITLRGARAAVVLSADDYDRLVAGAGPSLVDHLLNGPVWDQEFTDAVDKRANTPSRDVPF
jgi:prevent-host-death family protein